MKLNFSKPIDSHSDSRYGTRTLTSSVSGKDVSAGRITYQQFSNSLDIVGAGTSGSTRLVRVWDRLGIDNVRNLNVDQIYAAMYGAIKHLIAKVESLEAQLSSN